MVNLSIPGKTKLSKQKEHMNLYHLFNKYDMIKIGESSVLVHKVQPRADCTLPSQGDKDSICRIMADHPKGE
jgi:hypothetical protein